MGDERGESEKDLDVAVVASRCVLTAVLGRETAFARVLIAGLEAMSGVVFEVGLVKEMWM